MRRRRNHSAQAGGSGRVCPALCLLVTAVAWALGIRSLSPLLALGSWSLELYSLAVLAPLLASVAHCLIPPRRRRRHLWVVLTSALGAGAALVWFLHAHSLLEVWMSEPAATVTAIQTTLSTTFPPVEVSGPLASFLALTLTAASAASVMVAAAGGDRLGLPVLIPSSLLMALPLAQGKSTPWGLTVACALTWLVCIALATPPGPSRPYTPRGLLSRLTPQITARHRRRDAAASDHRLPVQAQVPTELPGEGIRVALTRSLIGALALTLAIVGSFLLPLPQPGQGHRGSVVSQLQLELNRDLIASSGKTLLSFRGVEADEHVRITLAIIRDLDTDKWTPLKDTTDASLERSRQDDEVDALTAAAPFQSLTGGMSVSQREAYLKQLSTTEILIGEMSSDYLPMLQHTVTASDFHQLDPSQWQWVSQTDTVRSWQVRTIPGMRYRVAGLTIEHSPGRYSSGEFFGNIPYSPDLPRYTQLPDDLPASIGQQAAEVIRDAGAERSNNFGKADALTTWLRSSRFRYDTSAPGSLDGSDGTPTDTIVSFLKEKKGYCIHFASAFTVMARSQGIPTRIAVGFSTIASDAGPDQWTKVTGASMHAWPEIWDEKEGGWVAVEPTSGGAGNPNFQESNDSPALPAPTTASGSREGAQENTPAPPSASAAATSPAASASPTPQPTAVASHPIRWWPWLGLTALGGVLILALWRIRDMRRRRCVRRIRSGSHPAAAAWAEVITSAVEAGLLPAPTWRETLLALVSARRWRPPAPRSPQPVGGRAVGDGVSPHMQDVDSGSEPQTDSMGRPRARTPEAAAAYLSTYLPPQAGQALERLSAAVVAERYAPRGPASKRPDGAGSDYLSSAGSSRATIAADLRTVLSHLASYHV